MRCIRGENGKENLLAVAEIDKIYSKVAGVAIKDEQSVPLPRFLLYCTLKHLFKPR
jgi:hypothetical protein